MHARTATWSRSSERSITNVGCQQVEAGSASFLFIKDLTDNATGAVLVALLVLYVGSQLLSSVLMSVTADRNQRMIMLALPFVFVPFIQSFPAGLIVYWITTNLWTVGQQYLIRRTAGLPVRGVPGAATTGGLAGLMSGRTKDEATDDGKAGVEPGAKAGRAERRGQRATSANGADGASRPPKPRSAPPPPPRRRKKKTGRRR